MYKTAISARLVLRALDKAQQLPDNFERWRRLALRAATWAPSAHGRINAIQNAPQVLAPVTDDVRKYLRTVTGIPKLQLTQTPASIYHPPSSREWLAGRLRKLKAVDKYRAWYLRGNKDLFLNPTVGLKVTGDSPFALMHETGHAVHTTANPRPWHNIGHDKMRFKDQYELELGANRAATKLLQSNTPAPAGLELPSVKAYRTEALRNQLEGYRLAGLGQYLDAARRNNWDPRATATTWVAKEQPNFIRRVMERPKQMLAPPLKPAPSWFGRIKNMFTGATS